MAIDVEALLSRVVGEVFDEGVSVVLENVSAERPQMYYARASSRARGRSANLVATYEWFVLHVSDVDVSVILFDCDHDEADKHRALRELALVARAYLDGHGRVECRKRFLRGPRSTRLILEVDGRRWTLGKRVSAAPFP